MNNVCCWHYTGLSVPSYPGTKEADRLNQISLIEMTLYIYVNTPLKTGYLAW